MSEMELKPCPLCQSAARISKKTGVTGTACKSRYYREHVICKRCELRTKDFKRPGLAVKAWNTRPTGAMREALEACEEYFDQRADAEYFTDSPAPVPNEEMTLLATVRAALNREA